MTKKCIVLDLDNTLWGGVVGEDGPQGIALGISPPGSYFLAFQQALLDLWNKGIILAINSANNFDDAMEVLETNPNMLLKPSHFAAMRINWTDKVENMRSLAQELNIGPDSMVFFDDTPQNRTAMRELLPEVETPELPRDPAEYAQFLHTLPYFKGGAITDEDKMRGNMYVTERLRKESEKSYSSKEDFLKSLRLTLEVHENDESVIPRLAQLSEKTNQFNTHKKPANEKEIKEMMKNSAYAIYHGRVTDIFGDYGITAVAFVHKKKKAWTIDPLFMSCRILGRGIEEAFVRAIAEQAVATGVPRLELVFVETPKNAPAHSFVDTYFPNGSMDPSSFISPAWVRRI